MASFNWVFLTAQHQAADDGRKSGTRFWWFAVSVVCLFGAQSLARLVVRLLFSLQDLVFNTQCCEVTSFCIQ